MSGHSRRAAIGAALALAAAGALTTVLPASAAGLACGDTVNQSTRLTHDLDCSGYAGNALVIGADNVTLDLKGFTITGPGTASYSGVLAARKTGVTVTNGTVTGFRFGVTFDQTSGGTIAKIAALDNFRGLELANAAGATVIKNKVAGSIHSDGVRLGGASNLTVVAQNTLDNNNWGISVTDAKGAIVRQNVVTGSRAAGIAVFDHAEDAIVSQNTVTGGWNEGIRTSAPSTGSIVSQNKATSNGGVGITVVNGTVIKNTATFNGGLGILAIDSTDGGGNKAAYNAEPQCVGVVCSAP